MSKPPPQNDECYEENFYAVNEQTRSFRPSAQGSNQEIGTKVKRTKVGTIVTITLRVIMSEMETTTVTKTSTGVTMVTKIIGMGPVSLLKIVK